MFLIHRMPYFFIAVIMSSGVYSNLLQAAVMDFETPVMPSAVFGNDSEFYTQGGLQHTSIDFTDGETTSHVHGSFHNNDNRMSVLEADAGGGLFKAATGNAFSFQSWDLVKLNLARIGGGESTFHVVGIRNGVKVADTTLTNEELGTTVDFIARDADFGNVDQVEYWFTPPGRGINPTEARFNQTLFGLVTGIDNVNFDLQAKPVPDLSVGISASQTSFFTGESLVLDAGISTPGMSAVVDIYLIVVLPDGNNVLMFTDLEGNYSFGNLSDIAGMVPMVASVNLASPYNNNLADFFTYNWAGQEPAGSYVAYLVVTNAGALADGNIDPGDIFQITDSNFSFNP